MIDPAHAVFFIPAHLKKFKLDLFNRVGATIVRAGGRVIRGDFEELAEIGQDEIPIVGCTPELRSLIDKWSKDKHDFVYWDRGYFRRVFATWLPRGTNGGYYRWHLNSFQLQQISAVSEDRWSALTTPVTPWRKNGRHVVIAAPTATYSQFHQLDGWTDKTLDALSRATDRPLTIRGKETKRPLQADLDGAHCLVTHGSIAGVEAVILGTPVFVDQSSAAALVGKINLEEIERPTYPDRDPWLRSLAYSQFSERELVDGTLWRLLT